MRIKEKTYGSVTVLSLSGKMMMDAHSSDLHRHVKKLVDSGKKQVVMDLGKVSWLASIGLGAILASYTSLKNADGDLKIARASRKIRSLFIFTQLIDIFKDYDSVDEAVASFSV
ncbi:MAG: STAS domain-containing protein [Candidatus Neomarinimicrobiota bacterium]